MIRNQIWNNFCNEKFKANYLNILNSRLRMIDLGLNFLMAFAASASIASWLVWEVFPWLWAGVFALSQLVVVAKPFAPYLNEYKRLMELELLHRRFAFEFEKLWNQLEKKKIQNPDEHLWAIKEEMNREMKAFVDLNVPNLSSIRKAARKKRNVYLKINHGIEI